MKTHLSSSCRWPQSAVKKSEIMRDWPSPFGLGTPLLLICSHKVLCMSFWKNVDAEMRYDLADYAKTGQQPSGLHLASLQGPCLTINFWNTTFVSLQYHLGLIILYSIVTRQHFISSTSTPSSKSQVHSHFTIPTLLPQFPTFYPSVSLNHSFILFALTTITILLFCPDHMTLILCDMLMHLWYHMIIYTFLFYLQSLTK